MDWVGFAVVALAGGLNLAGISYPSLAPIKGWPVGAWAHSDKWAIYFWAGVIAVAFSSWHVGGILALLLAAPASFVVGFALSAVLGRNVQMVSLLGPPTGIAAFILTM